MLPDGFEWRPYVHGPGLFVRDRVVAHAGPARDDPESPWRIDLNPSLGLRRSHFVATEVEARAYIEQWAARWAGRLLEMYR